VHNLRRPVVAVDARSPRHARPAQPWRMTDNDSKGAASPRRNDHGSAATRARQQAGREAVRVQAGSPDALLALIPHLLGFYPSRSLVVLGLSGDRGRIRVTFRYDLPDPVDATLAADIADHAASVLRRQRISRAALVGYGPAALVAPVLAVAMDWLSADGVQLREVLRADGGRYWSVLCDEPACCPREGRPFDPGSHPAAAAMSKAGLPALPDRAALARTLLPPAGSAESIRRSTRLAEQRLCDLGSKYWADGGRDQQQFTARVGCAAVRRAIRSYRAGGSVANGDELAWLAVLLADLRVRDDAWARMDPAHREAHHRLWTDVLRGAAAEYVPAPASLLAFAAWQSGNGALASVAIDRALAARPGYSMALLLGGALEAGLPPSAAKLPMTPAEVAASYAAQAVGAGQPGRAGSRRPKRAGSNQPDSARSPAAGTRSAAAAALPGAAGTGPGAAAALPGAAGTRSGSRTSGASKRPSG
jgi:hypothetical protein